MALHFTREEFADRQRRTRAEMAKAGLEGLLIFRQESMYLTGYDTSGYSMFQGRILQDGELRIDNRCQRLVGNLDPTQCVFSQIPAFGKNGDDRLTDIAHLAAR
jgi:Xaa-Pro aminopeptidase